MAIALGALLVVNFNAFSNATYDLVWGNVYKAMVAPLMGGTTEVIEERQVSFEMMLFLNNFSVGNLIISYLIMLLTVWSSGLSVGKKAQLFEEK